MKRMIQAFELIFDFFNAFNKEATRRLSKEVFNNSFLTTTGCCIVQRVSVGEQGPEFEVRYNYVKRRVDIDIVQGACTADKSFMVLEEVADFFNRFEV